MSVPSLLTAVCLGTTAALLICLALVVEAHRPAVQTVWPTGECVRVLPPSAGTCLDVPPDARRVWVGRDATDT